MEKQNVSNTKNAMIYGLILGVILILFHLVQYILGIYKAPGWVSILNYAIIIGGIVYGTIRFRDDNLGGYISYSKALGSGVLICLFASIIYGFYFYILTSIIDPAYMENVHKVVEETYLEMGMDADQVENMMEMVKKFQTPVIMVLSSVFGFTLMGFVFSLITSIFIKKEEPLFDTNN
jgi:uncharacterized protein involved in cysteine biosynthesis